MSEKEKPEVEEVEEKKTTFQVLSAIDVSKHTAEKDKLTYYPWSVAWSELKFNYPDATYEVLEDPETNLPVFNSEKLGYIVKTRVTVAGDMLPMWLPVMNGANKSMKDHKYTYKVREYKNGKWTGGYVDKEVESATMFDVNKTIMRCLVKNFAMHGLAINIFNKDDVAFGDMKDAELSKEEEEKRQKADRDTKALFKKKQTMIDWIFKEEDGKSKDLTVVIDSAKYIGLAIADGDTEQEVAKKTALDAFNEYELKNWSREVARRLKIDELYPD